MKKKSERPNILLITTDQQRFDTMACAGNRHIYTPHLDWLANEGVFFTRTYTDAPACIPARISIMTGRPGYRQGLTTMGGPVNPLYENKTLPAAMTEAGYQTRAQGKMHFIPMRANHGFESMELPLDYIRERGRYGKTTPVKAHGLGENEYMPGIDSVPDDETFTHWTIQRSIDFLETRDETRPYFLWTSFGKPHPPFAPTANFWNLYANKTIPERAIGDWSKKHSDVPRGFMGGTYGVNNTWDADEEQRIDTKRAYYACVTQIDYQLGILFARMREMGLLENTWILFTADHGDMMGDHQMFGKGVFFEGSAHVPMIVRAPSKTWDHNKPFHGQKVETLSSLADVMPTILSIAGVNIPKSVEGKNLLHFVDKPDPKREFYGNMAQHYFCVMEGDYKYTYTPTGDCGLLFDMRKDPMEKQNLASKPKHQKLKTRLHKKLLKEMGSYPCPAIKKGKWVTRKAPKTLDKRFCWPGFHSTVHPCDVIH